MAHDHTVLVLQGGGALGAYQAGVYEGMAEEGIAPDWVAGVSIGAINGALVAGNTVEHELGAEHIMASGSLPPGFPPVMIEGEHYWDGGIVSNSPLSYVLDDSPALSALILQVDLFSAKGELPANLDQVLERAKDIQYSSKTRFNTKRVQQLEDLRQALTRLMEKFPPGLHDDPDYKLLKASLGHKREITIAHLINRRFAHSANSKDYEFSRTTVRELWQAGLDDVRYAAAHRDWLKATQVASGVQVFDLSRRPAGPKDAS